jgi:hypothetical protein
MRVLVALFLAAALLCSVSSAEFLTTANTLGQGNWGVLGAYVNNPDAYGLSGSSTSAIGGYVAYGVMDNLDAYFQVGSLSGTGLLSATAGTALALNVKYGLIKEGADSPVSVAVGGGYKSTSVTAPTSTSLSSISISAGVSKVLAPFAPYLGVSYKMNSADGASDGSQIDLTVGSAIAWSEQGAIFVEGSSMSVTPAGGGAASSYTQMAAGVGYSL